MIFVSTCIQVLYFLSLKLAFPSCIIPHLILCAVRTSFCVLCVCYFYAFTCCFDFNQENFLKNLQRLQPPYVDYDILDVRAPKWPKTKSLIGLRLTSYIVNSNWRLDPCNLRPDHFGAFKNQMRDLEAESSSVYAQLLPFNESRWCRETKWVPLLKDVESLKWCEALGQVMYMNESWLQFDLVLPVSVVPLSCRIGGCTCVCVWVCVGVVSR